MARGKYLSLEEARKLGQLDQFAREHPSKGEKSAFDNLLGVMASGKPPEGNRTSDAGSDED